MNWILREWRRFLTALILFTRLPVTVREFSDDDIPRALAYFPAVGWIVGSLAAAVWWLSVHLWPPMLASGLSLAATLIFTGAFHEDGWTDMCDGFGGAHEPRKVLEIMVDSRIGAFGAIGAIVMLGLKWQAVAALPLALTPMVLIAAHASSRALSASLVATMRYVRTESKVKPNATQITVVRLSVAIASGVVPFLFLPRSTWWCLLFGLALRVGLVVWFRRRIGGYTGDCLGAAQQLGELCVYLTIVALT